MPVVFPMLAGPFGLGLWEILLIAAVVLLLFGSRLPGLMRSLGKSVVEFKKGLNDTDDGPPKRIE